MFLFSNLIVEIIIALIAIIAVSLLWIVLIKSGKQQVVKTRDASLTCEELEEHARKTAVEHFVDSRKNMIKWPIPRMNDNYNVIFSVYKSFNEEVRKKHTIPPAAEWLLDNFYILEEQVKIIKNDLKKSEYALLPVLKCGELKGYARVQAVAMDLIAHTDGQMDENIIYNYLKAYQSHSTLLDREIWSLPVIIRIALIENIRSICEKIRDTQVQWNKADEIIDNWLENEGADADKIIKTVNNKFKAIDEIYPSFIEHLSYRLRREKKGYTQILKFIDDNLARFGTQLEDIMQKEHNSQAVSAVSMGNCILSIKYISTFEWTEIFESTSQVEQTLRNDPVGIYPLMDFASRNYYRSSIAKLSSKLDISELHIAREAVEQAKEATDQAGEIKHEAADIRISHVGYYLVGKGLGSLVKKLTENKKTLRMADSCSVKYSKTLYIGAIIFFTLLLSATAAYYAYRTASICRILLAVIAVLAVILPISEIVTSALNWLICSIHKPYTFPRLELKKGIPEDMLTVIVIPALLPDEKRVKELLENLERHYLANKDDNLYYALVGDFKDADVSRLDSDETIVQAALNGIAELNSRYPGNNRDVFYYFHRQRKFNESHKRWMGWERKRGALIEFNNLLLGSKETGFAYYSGTALLDVRVKYVITLDADTILPIGMAKKMIGTMAHPLNRPVIDFKRGIVVEGYGLMQPKVSYDIESSNKSLFSRIFTGQEGIDPYPNAVSDIYQDLFCEGIYTGKGIYDLKVFQTVLENAIPDDRVLSHDLLEGSYIRTGLATDLELVDSYPSRYNSYFARIHRWVRGDWQLLPWLFGKVLDRNGILINNPLTFISKWKIFDNMRRSLIAPSALILVLLSFLILPGSSLVWAGISVLNIIFPLVLATSNCLFSRHVSSGRIKRYIPVISGLKAIMLQVVLMLIFLPYQAYLMDHAITVTLIRVLFTKKNMLEWVTAADVEKGQKNSLKSYWSKMWFAGFTGVLTAVFAIVFKPAWIVLALFFMVIWIISPNIAYFISKTYPVKTFRLTEENSDELKRIARKTWRYFEEFADFRNHYLAPDNYQEDPPRGIAYRTSPTNIGLGLMALLSARDLGYVGTSEMLDLISNTINTIEKLEKWNGHLYNWYDTRTLRPLRPRYVSTVDSGNMVCYLITLVQGMKEYLDQPLIDSRFIDGIKITLKLVGKEGTEVCGDVEYYMNIVKDSTINVTEWNKIIDQLLDENKIFNTRRSPWKAKAYHMLKMFKKEISDFMPWHELLNSLPEDDSAPENENINEIVQNIKEELMAPVPIKDFKSVYENVLGIIAKGIETIKSMNGRNPNSTLNWLEGLQSKVSEALEFSIGFIGRYNELTERIRTLSEVVKFEPLFMEKKQMFSIGFNIEEGRLTNSFYDLLASESRQTSYIAIARGEVPAKHWFKLGRALTVVDYYKGLISWTGTMFEYLMPLLLMKSYKNTLLDETYSFVIRSQKKYGKQRNVPWGASESCFYSLDINLDYQYKAIGVPWLGLKRGLIEDAVAAPYATFLALMVDPEESIANIKALKAQGAEGPYGFYEAVDYTPGRIPFGAKRAVIKCFMAHHEGMSLLSLNNFLNDFILQKRFHSDPVVKSAQLLLQEKVPANIVYTKEAKEKVAPFKDIVYKEKGPVRKFRLPDPILPKTHILSNGNYSVMVTDRGTGFSKSKTAAITRWRDDSTLDNYGMFFYIRNTGTNSVWSACYAPINVTPDKYEVTYLSDKARFRRLDGDVETQTEIVVTSGDNAEIRRITLKNYGQVSYTIEVTSYFEVVIASQAADIAHPAFSNLFVRTEFLPETGTIIAHRRPRTEIEKSLWIANTVVVEGDVVGDLQYETDRAQFIGRGHNLSSPAVILHNKPLSNTTGPVLDPIISQRIRVKIEPGKSARLSFITIASETSETLTELIEKNKTPEAVEGAFRLAQTRSQVEARYLNMKAAEIELYQDIISHILFISPLRRLNQEIIAQNSRGQQSLWAYGISGDLPIVLVVLKKSDEVDMLYEVLKMHEYWRIKDLKADLVILNDEENSYTHPLKALLSDIITSSHAHDIINKPGGIFILNWNNMPREDICLFHAAARFVVKGDSGTLADQLKKVQGIQLPKYRHFIEGKREYPSKIPKELELQYFNGMGGFSRDGKEYVLRLEKGQNTPMPWINVIANRNFGFIVSEAGSGYTWFENSRENKLSPWSNDPVSDTPGEVLYLSDYDTGELWTVTPLPIREEETYIITHGFGYTSFEHISHGIEQSMVQFVPVNDTVKISHIKIKNISKFKRNVALTYYIRPVLGVSDQLTAMHVKTVVGESGEILIENPYNEEFKGRVAYLDVSEKERSFTGDRKEFFGNGKLCSPDALKRQKLSGTLGTGYDPCAAVQTIISLDEGEEKELVFIMGMSQGADKVGETIEKFRNIDNVHNALTEVRNFWADKLDNLQVETPDASMNLLLNGWLLYQVVACRIWARTAFYQAGGAYGFRDQLQDSLAAVQVWPELARNQILLHSQHQFLEGDVQHWWHEPQNKGTRTRFSDDLLWMPYTVSQYVQVTGDYGILDETRVFLEDEPLKEFEDERYSVPKVSSQQSSIYDHCIRAIDRSLKFGEHGLPLIGSGDWNDGMNTVGNRGFGESVWLGWFLYTILKAFAPICVGMGDNDKALEYGKTAERLSQAIDKDAWDGNWYRRAYFDNGIPLGSIQNTECKIDSIAQTWAVISGGGRSEKIGEAMNSLENYLVLKEEGLIKLLTPPFDEGDLQPGYIKGYVPGVRENGGQYTHAAAWAIIAFALLGEGDKACELFNLINPVNHTRTHMEYSRYKAEPYVMAADVYAAYPHVGRGGWTWYTGSAGWMYRAGIEYLLGFKKNGSILKIEPCIPEKWTRFGMIYKYSGTIYKIDVQNPEGVSMGTVKTVVDGAVTSNGEIQLVDDGREHVVVVYMGKGES